MANEGKALLATSFLASAFSPCQHTLVPDPLPYLNFAIALAREAGAIIREALDRRFDGQATVVLEKYENPSDLVTETDQAVEKYIKQKLAEVYPGHK